MSSVACGFGPRALFVLLLIFIKSFTEASARPVHLPTGRQKPLPSPLRLQSEKPRAKRGPESVSGSLNLETLRRGSLYAVNIDGTSSFKLHHLDPAVLEHLSGPDSLRAHLRATYSDASIGWVWYADTYLEDGWYRLEIWIDEDTPFPDVVKARAAGFVEGILQGQHMYRYWTNYRRNQYRCCGEAPSQQLYDFFDEQYDWMTRKVQDATGWSRATLRGEAEVPEASVRQVAELEAPGGGDSDAGGRSGRRYWAMVGLVAAQFEGLAAGFWATVVDPSQNMTWHELYTLNAMGDLYELNVLFPPPEAQPSPPPEPEGAALPGPLSSVRQRRYSPGHGEVGEYGYGELLDCSAIIKIELPDDQDEGGGEGGEGGDAAQGAGSGGHGDALHDDSGHAGGEDLADLHDIRSHLTGGELSMGAAARRLLAGSVASGARATLLGRERRHGQQQLQRPHQQPVLNFLASHNTWRSYYEMVRTWKVYDLPWSSTGPLTVSSSPGLLHSKDDWYTTDQFVVMETTNGIYNKDLYDLIEPKSVLMWQRVQVANFGARSGSEWVDFFGRHNSGTYNNQWMVLDVPLLEAGYRTDVLWVLEQMPGIIVSDDVSDVLFKQGYWASYNVPYFPEIYNITRYPVPSIYATCPRAQIFSREQSRVSSLSDLMSLMRLNRYLEDPLSLGLPNNAIAARYDLPAASNLDGQPRNWTKRAYGAVDAKMVDLESFRDRRTFVINGPTDDDQPSFRWSAEPLFDGVYRDGCVDEFTFGWQAYQSITGPPLHTERWSQKRRR